MALTLNRGYGSLLVPPAGYPVRLQANGETELVAMAGRYAATVTATVQASKTATVWLGLFHAPRVFATQAGTITATAGSRMVTGSATTFTTSSSTIRQGLTGYEIRPQTPLWSMRVALVVSDTSLSLVDEVPAGGTVSGAIWEAGSNETVVVDRDTDGEITKTYQTSSDIDSTEATVTLDFPLTDSRPPTSYLVKLWATDITGDAFDTVNRYAAVITDTTTQPKLPGYVLVNTLAVS